MSEAKKSEGVKARGDLPAIDIKGKPYVTVAERVKAVTHIEALQHNEYEIEKWERFEMEGKNFLTCHIVVGSTESLVLLTTKTNTEGNLTEETRQIPVKTIGKRYSGTAQISFTGGMVNSTSGYENAETSALGRALGFAGIGLLEGVASADEINKATDAAKKSPVSNKPGLVEPRRLKELQDLMAKREVNKAALARLVLDKERPENQMEVNLLIAALSDQAWETTEQQLASLALLVNED